MGIKLTCTFPSPCPSFDAIDHVLYGRTHNTLWTCCHLLTRSHNSHKWRVERPSKTIPVKVEHVVTPQSCLLKPMVSCHLVNIRSNCICGHMRIYCTHDFISLFKKEQSLSRLTHFSLIYPLWKIRVQNPAPRRPACVRHVQLCPYAPGSKHADSGVVL